jgi:undecaprenyl-diphosphatase
MGAMDFELDRFINQLGRGAVEPLTELVCRISFLVALWMLLALAALRLDKKAGRRVFGCVLLAMAIHFVVSEALLKHALLTFLPMRTRPYLAHPDEIVAVGQRFEDSSFPSSHAASTAAVLTVLAWHYRRAWPLALAFALLMCFSRVHNGMHYPSDVLAGSTLGFGYGLFALHLMKRIERRRAAAVAPAKAVPE